MTKPKGTNRKKFVSFVLPIIKNLKGVAPMPSEELEKLKQQQHKLKQLTRSERTHRLCTRAGMLEKFLREPTLLTDDDVMELLTFIFHGEAVQKKLDLLIEKRKKEATTEDGES